MPTDLRPEWLGAPNSGSCQELVDAGWRIMRFQFPGMPVGIGDYPFCIAKRGSSRAFYLLSAHVGGPHLWIANGQERLLEEFDRRTKGAYK